MGILDFIAFFTVADFEVNGRFSRMIYKLMRYSFSRFKPHAVTRFEQIFLFAQHKSWSTLQDIDKLILL